MKSKKKMRKRVPVKALKDRNVSAKTISLPPDLMEWVDEQADKHNRNRSNWIAWVLERLRKGAKIDRVLDDDDPDNGDSNSGESPGDSSGRKRRR